MATKRYWIAGHQNFVYKHRQTGETITKSIHPLKEYEEY